MKNILFLSLSILSIFALIYSCSAEEEDTSPPPAVTQPQESEPDPTQYTLSITDKEGGSVFLDDDSSNKYTGGSYDEGTIIKLIARAEEGYIFSEWSDGSTNESIEINLNSNSQIFAIFINCNIFKQTIPDWSQKSYDLFQINFPLNKDGSINATLKNSLGGLGTESIMVDYNNDGFLDIISFTNNYDNFIDMPVGYTGYERKQPIEFYLGDCEYNYFVDDQNNDKFLGLVHGRKILLGDFNKDDFVDIFFIGHGYDRQPFPGEFPSVLMSDGNGSFNQINFQDEVSFFHGGASGDFDNDGDLDVFIIEPGNGKSAILVNNESVFDFNKTLIDHSLTQNLFNAELFDLNKDGFLDIIAGGHDWDNEGYNKTPLIIYGDGVDFVGNDIFRMPQSNIESQGVVTDFEFYDLNDNGNYEIIISRTGDPYLNTSNFYKGWSIQVLELIENKYVEATEKFIDNFSGDDTWIVWLKMHEKSGVIKLTNAWPENDNFYKEWSLSNGFLKRSN